MSDLRHALEHLAHHLPGQAAISEFVHHNTLHGDQALGFVAAIEAATRRTGARGWPSPEQRTGWYRQGRVTDEDLDAVLAEHAGADEIVPGVRRRDALRVALTLEVGPVDASRLRWELVVRQAASTPHPDVSAAARARVGDGVAEVWAAVLAGLQLSDLDPHPEHLADLQPGLAAALQGAASDGADAAMLMHAEGRVRRLLGQIGHGAAHRELLLALTGVDVEALLRPYLVRWMSAFLDEGVASWSLDGRERGLWSTWRRLARSEPWDRWGLPDAPAQIAGLPEDGFEALEAGLDALGITPEQRAGVLEAMALRLPGFFGMTAWREARPQWAAQALHPARLADALAVRCALERLYVEQLAQARLGCGVALAELAAWMEARPVEVMVREALHGGRMPGHVAWRARAAEAGRLPGEAPFLEVARAWWTWNHTRDGNMPGRPTLARAAWPVFRLCLGLGLRGVEVQAIGADSLLALLALVDGLDASTRGRLWLEAYERHYREEVLHGLHHNRGRAKGGRAALQVACCIDDREEGLRRHLEALAPEVETFGVAGFFGVPMLWRGLDDPGEVALCPPAVTAVHRVWEAPRGDVTAHQAGLGWLARLRRALARLRLDPLLQTVAATTVGPLFAVPTAWRALAPVSWERALGAAEARVAPPVLTEVVRTRAGPPPPAGSRAGFSLDEQADRVLATLRNIGLVEGFAPLVIWLGHGSHSRNNPHLAAYDCGACGGRHGGPNARVFAAMANDPEVRQRLRARGVDIPDSTWFLGAEHDTCDETFTWYDLVDLPGERGGDLARARALLDEAGRRSAHERCRRFEHAPASPTPEAALRHVRRRAKDPFQARPELGHVTNAAAIVGRRALSRGLFLDRRSFLVSYDPAIDADGSICERILAAVGPVGAGISLEYYFSTVDNERFGCGTKVNHNPFGLIGVMEGARSDLRTGLPRQMIEIHEPMRLLLIVEQTPEVLAGIVARQPEVAELVLGAWVQVVSIDPVDGHAERFVPGVGFVRWEPTRGPPPRVARSEDWYGGHDGPRGPALVGGDHA
jgi:uncharacterized protein YbcC (UPF0753/DUF2309 family)